MNLFEPHCPCYICGVRHELTLANYNPQVLISLMKSSRLDVNQLVDPRRFSAAPCASYINKTSAVTLVSLVIRFELKLRCYFKFV